MASILDGKKLANQKLAELAQRIAGHTPKPGLAIILVGDHAASKLYVSLKEKAAKKIGIHVTTKRFAATATTTQITKAIAALNTAKNIHGIIVQLPLPASVDTNEVISAIEPVKDVDGFHPKNINDYLAGNGQMPLLINVIDQLVHQTGQQGASAAIIARESVFSAGLEHYFLSQEMQASRCELGSVQLKNADIVVIALGQPHALTGTMIKPDAVVIDIGITKQHGKTLGDADPSVAEVASWVTPVPGGVGPLTVATLLERTANNAFHV